MQKPKRPKFVSAVGHALPKGFKSYTGGADGKAWDGKEKPILHGVVVGVKTLDAKAIGRQNAKKGDKVKLVTVAEKGTGELFAVWESKALEEFCAAVKPKNEVYLAFKGVKKIGKKRFNMIDAGIK